MVPTFTAFRSTGEVPGFAPAVSSWLRRRPSPRPVRPDTYNRPDSSPTPRPPGWRPRGQVRTAHQPRSTGFELVDDEEASRHRFLAYTFPSCSPGTARPVVPNRPDFVAAAPTLPGIPRVRLPPASPSRYDDQAMQVSHLHPKQQRLVAHDMLVHAKWVNPGQSSGSGGAAGLIAFQSVCQDTPS